MALACTTISGSLDESVSVPYGRTAVFPGELRVAFTKLVSDSRCPVDVQCIQRGDAVVELTVTLGATHETVQLSTDTNGAKNEARAFGYRIELRDVAPPATKTPRPARDYSVVIRVSRA